MENITVKHHDQSSSHLGFRIRSENKVYGSIQEVMYDKNKSGIFRYDSAVSMTNAFQAFGKSVLKYATGAAVLYSLTVLFEHFFATSDLPISQVGMVFSIIYFMYYILDEIQSELFRYSISTLNNGWMFNNKMYYQTCILDPRSEGHSVVKIICPLSEADISEIRYFANGIQIYGKIPYYYHRENHNPLVLSDLTPSYFDTLFITPFCDGFYDVFVEKLAELYDKEYEPDDSNETIEYINDCDNYDVFLHQVSSIAEQTNDLINERDPFSVYFLFSKMVMWATTGVFCLCIFIFALISNYLK